jgi:hypothetical protein
MYLCGSVFGFLIKSEVREDGMRLMETARRLSKRYQASTESELSTLLVKHLGARGTYTRTLRPRVTPYFHFNVGIEHDRTAMHVFGSHKYEGFYMRQH